MAKTLNANVIVRDQNNETRVLLAGTEVPEWAEGQLGDHLTALTLPSEKPAREEDPAAEGYPGANQNGTEENPDDDFDEDADEEDAPYSEWTKEELKAEAKQRELTGYGSASKDDLVKLLEADDAIQSETEED